MSERARFFNRRAGDADGDFTYSADDFAEYLNTFFSDGVVGACLRVYSTGNRIVVPAGYAILNGHWYNNDQLIYLTNPTENVDKRKDCIALKLDKDERTINAVWVTGSASAYPTLTSSDSVKYLKLADVEMLAGGVIKAVNDKRKYSQALYTITLEEFNRQWTQFINTCDSQYNRRLNSMTYSSELQKARGGYDSLPTRLSNSDSKFEDITQPGTANLYDYTKSIIGELNNNGGIDIQNSNFYTTDFIPFANGTSVYFYNDVGDPVACDTYELYRTKSADGLIKYDNVGGSSVVNNQNARYIRLTFDKSVVASNYLQITNSDIAPTYYISYQLAIKPEAIPESPMSMSYITDNLSLTPNEVYTISDTVIASNSPVNISIQRGGGNSTLVRADGVELIDQLTGNVIDGTMTEAEITADDVLAGVKLTEGGTLTVNYYSAKCTDLIERVNSDYVLTDADKDEIASKVDDYMLTKKARYYPTLSDLIADKSTLATDTTAVTLGYYAQSDGGGATYYIRAKSDSDTDNGIDVIIGDYVAELVPDDTINLRQAGCKIDGVTDDYSRVMAVSQYVNKHPEITTVVMPYTGSTLMTSDTIVFNRGDLTLDIHCDIKLTKASYAQSGDMTALQVAGALNNTIDNVNIIGHGITVDGNGFDEAIGEIDITTLGMSSSVDMRFVANGSITGITAINGFKDCLTVSYCQYVIVDNCKAYNSRHDNGINAAWAFNNDETQPQHIIFRNCCAENTADLGFSTWQATATFENCTAYNCGFSDTYNSGGGISCEIGKEGNTSYDLPTKAIDVTIRNCKISNCAGYGLYCDKMINLTVDGLYIDGITHLITDDMLTDETTIKNIAIIKYGYGIVAMAKGTTLKLNDVDVRNCINVAYFVGNSSADYNDKLILDNIKISNINCLSTVLKFAPLYVVWFNDVSIKNIDISNLTHIKSDDTTTAIMCQLQGKIVSDDSGTTTYLSNVAIDNLAFKNSVFERLNFYGFDTIYINNLSSVANSTGANLIRPIAINTMIVDNITAIHSDVADDSYVINMLPYANQGVGKLHVGKIMSNFTNKYNSVDTVDIVDYYAN